ncbi:hypothetical protein TrLO_g9314 [Triparma laevis f. longispina]|nr:hypothetical protein TrLO_g9314 [Triparma laevis f. longispina]
MFDVIDGITSAVYRLRSRRRTSNYLTSDANKLLGYFSSQLSRLPLAFAYPPSSSPDPLLEKKWLNAVYKDLSDTHGLMFKERKGGGVDVFKENCSKAVVKKENNTQKYKGKKNLRNNTKSKVKEYMDKSSTLENANVILSSSEASEFDARRCALLAGDGEVNALGEVKRITLKCVEVEGGWWKKTTVKTEGKGFGGVQSYYEKEGVRIRSLADVLKRVAEEKEGKGKEKKVEGKEGGIEVVVESD